MSYAPALILRQGDLERLADLARLPSVPSGLAKRARMVLLAADGMPTAQIARTAGVSRPAVIGWRDRYQRGGIAALEDEPRPGRPAEIDEIEVVVTTLADDGRPPERLGITHWPARFLAAELGISFASVARTWRRWRIQPHRIETFKFSADPQPEARIRDVVGLYLDPPENAVVVSADEKSQIQAYPGGDPSACDGGQETDMPDSGSVTDGLSGVRPRQSRRPRTDGLDAASAEPGGLHWSPACDRLVVAASVADASATVTPAEIAPLIFRTPDKQALDRTAPPLPLRPGPAARRTHDYKRHGTTTLFAALEVATGKITADACYPRHRHQEFPRFLKKAAAARPGTGLHVVLDNYGTRKHPAVRAWLTDNPRITLHFTPAGCSWPNMAEIFSGIITRQAIRRGSFTSVTDLTVAIGRFIDAYNDRCHPFSWTKNADDFTRQIKP
jgi:transposase